MVAGAIVAAYLIGLAPGAEATRAVSVDGAVVTGAPIALRAAAPPPRVWVSADPLARKRPITVAPAPGLVRPLGRCCSERRGRSRVDAIVLHSTETVDRDGLDDLQRLARLMKGNGVGAHVANDGGGNSSRMASDARLAYHATYWNVATVGIEQIGFAAFDRKRWLARPAQLEATARWIARWATKYRIPIRRCVVEGIRYNRKRRVIAGRIVRRGVCSHSQLDPRNRHDPGRGYPWDRVMARARALAR